MKISLSTASAVLLALALAPATAAISQGVGGSPAGRGTQVPGAERREPMQDTDLARATGAERLYALDAEANFVRGCFLPCACPLQLASRFRGTFTMRRVISQDTAFQAYVVDDVAWLVRLGTDEVLISGDGHYRVGAQGGAIVQSLQLDLRVGDDPVATFDSGLVPGGSLDRFPALDVSIDKNDQVCFDVVMGVSAAPVDEAGVLPYVLGRESEFTRGCLEPCACPIRIFDLGGTFGLLPLGPDVAGQEFAVVGVDWSMDPFGTEPGETARGAGVYRVTTGGLHELQLGLVVGGERTHYASGLVPGAGLPLLDIDVARNGFYCFDEVFSIDAQPAP